MIFFISDHHFFHKNIIKYTNRPFSNTVDGMYENAKYMFNKHNEIVKDGDLVFFLGDVALFKSNTKEYIKQMLKNLKGQKILIKGNHDSESDEFYKDCGFSAIYEYLIFGKIMLCHFPLTNNTKYLKIFKDNDCKLLIHGHTHDKNVITNDFKRLNVSVEQTDFKPFFNKKLNSIIEREIKRLKWVAM